MGKKDKSAKETEAPASPAKPAAKTVGKAKTHRVQKTPLKSFLNKICKTHGYPNLSSDGARVMESCLKSLFDDMIGLSASTLKPKTIYRPNNVHQSAVALFQLRGMNDKNCQLAIEFSKACLDKLQQAK